MSLPEIDNDGFISDEDGVWETYPLSQLNELHTVVKEYVNADCHAVVLDGEVLFNSYRECSYRDRILDYTVRDHISKSPHRHLFAPLLRQNRNFTIEIYMFGYANGPWKIVIDYDKTSKRFHLSKKV
jgi:hypothetical protein